MAIRLFVAAFTMVVAALVVETARPGFAATWTPIGPPDERVAEAVAVDPIAPLAIYVATPSGVFRTADGGTTWMFGSTRTGFLEFLTISPLDHALYAAGECIGCAVVYRSRNGGRHWTRRTRGLTSSKVTSLVIDPSAPKTMYAGTYDDGVFKTVNRGGRWTVLPSSPQDEDILGLAVDPQAPSTLYATTGSQGVWKTTDGGQTWAATNSGITGTDVALQGLAVNPQTPATVYVGGYISGHVLTSTDGGLSWTDASAGLPGAGVIKLLVDPATPSIVYAGTRGAGIFRSLDDGATWSDFSAGLPAAATVADLTLVPSVPRVLYAAGSEAVFAFVDP